MSILTDMEDLKVFEQRKKDHIRWALSSQTQGIAPSDFSRIRLLPNALPEMNFSEVDINVKLLGHPFSSPHFISSMTAGHKLGFQINSRLAEAAAEKNWLFCVGSQKKELIEAAVASDLKKISTAHKKTKFVSNIGLEEAIEFKSKDVLKIVDSIQAIGLIIHLNPLQEVFQNKDDVLMKHGLRSIEKIIKDSPVPVIVKEVGFGISSDTMKVLFNIGVSVIDVAGHGGTHWGMIEALRQKDARFVRSVEHFADWGLSTAECLLAGQHLIKNKNIWASGGIRSGVDSTKCLALGAKAVGVAQPLLKSIIKDNKMIAGDGLISVMEQFDFEMQTALFCMGIKNIDQLSKRKVWYEK